ncbi:hypothetical protein OG921_04410 [Aldersonia sp. NBC_00410]|uniref:RNA polymerase sigma factor n=1 Tax=Aldersonia sp. NBC_00410 TaxID=2975954 RepID=UPI002259CC8B|nr:hypothetical protein [Aldersonia sp. NBC_00410]MCX5042423.1 hypothetical protein [Aldersonia sp. NBC_00410]
MTFGDDGDDGGDDPRRPSFEVPVVPDEQDLSLTDKLRRGDAALDPRYRRLAEELPTGVDRSTAGGPDSASDDGASDADGALFDIARKAGFVGPAWDFIVEGIVGYGIAVMDGWVGSRNVYAIAREKGMPLRATDAQRARVTGDVADDLVNEAVIAALRKFRAAAMEGKGWRADGGAALRVYFVNRCVQEFVNEFRKLQRRGDLDGLSTPTGLAGEELPAQRSGGGSHFPESRFEIDFAGRMYDQEYVRRELADLTEDERCLLWWVAVGYTYGEIGEMLGGLASKTIEGRWAKLKHKRPWVAHLRAKGGRPNDTQRSGRADERSA